MNWELLQFIGKHAEKLNLDCYLIGGAVRDYLLIKKPKDYDFVCVNSEKLINSIESELSNLNVKKFKKYGTYQLRLFDEDVEFVNPRKEAYMTWSHKPLCKNGTIDDDILRRDFTINTLGMKITNKQKKYNIFDLTRRGLNDFFEKRLDCVSDPYKTFKEDPSRLVRLCIYASKGFEPTEEVIESAVELASEINRVPPDAIKQMMDKGIVENYFLFWMYKLGILQEIMSEFDLLDTYEQPQKHHIHNVWDHTIETVEFINKNYRTIRWAGLFHDIGKKYVWNERNNYHGHEIESEKIARKIMTKLKFSNQEIREISHLVRYHMDITSRCIHTKPTKRSIGRFFRRHEEFLEHLFILTIADIKASGVHVEKDLEKVYDFYDRLQELKLNINIVAEKTFKLDYSGHDIMNLFNIKPSETVGKIKSMLEEKVCNSELKNNYEKIDEYLKNNIQYFQQLFSL